MWKYKFSKPYTTRLYRLLKIRGLFFLILSFLTAGSLYPLPPQKFLSPGDWAYEAMAILSREQGRVFFTDSRITVAQMEKYLANIDPDSLSESALVIYDQLAAYLKSSAWLGFRSDMISGGLDLIVQPEFHFKTNKNVPWIYDAHSRNPMILIPWGFSLGPWITAEMDLNIGQNEYAATLHDNYVNIPLDPVSQFDIHFPKRAYVSAGVPVGTASGINFAIGIGNTFFGQTRTGSVIISEYLERTIFAEASIYSPAFKYTAQVLQYEVNKYHYMHYIQVRLHRTFSLSLAEGVMVNAPLELRFLNPFTIFHSYESYKTYTGYNEDLGHKKNEVDDPWDNDYDKIYDPTDGSRIGSYLGIKIEWQPFKFMRFYGLFAMDQFQLPVEESNWEESLTPNALAFQAGIDLSFPARGGYWEFGLEGVYTYPYMYVIWDKGWSFYKEVPEVENMTLRYWTGSPFGPDTIACAFWTGFRASTLWYGGFSFEFSARGERSELSIFDHDTSLDDTYRPTHAVYKKTVPPTGTPIFSYTVSLRGEYNPKQWLSLTLQPGYRINVNANHEEDRIEHGFEIAFSLRFKPPVKSKL